MSTLVQIPPVLLAATRQEFRWPYTQLVVTSDVLEWMNSRARTSNFVSLFRLSLVSLLPLLLLFAHQL
jgi:hypothetical protein